MKISFSMLKQFIPLHQKVIRRKKIKGRIKIKNFTIGL